MIEHPINGLEVLFALIMEMLGLGFQLLEPPLSVDVDGIFCMLSDVELGLELLRRLWFMENALSEWLLSCILSSARKERSGCGANGTYPNDALLKAPETHAL